MEIPVSGPDLHRSHLLVCVYMNKHESISHSTYRLLKTTVTKFRTQLLRVTIELRQSSLIVNTVICYLHLRYMLSLYFCTCET